MSNETEIQQPTVTNTETCSKSFADSTAFKWVATIGGALGGLALVKSATASTSIKPKPVPCLVGAAVAGLAAYKFMPGLTKELTDDITKGWQSADTLGERLKNIGANILNFKGQTYQEKPLLSAETTTDAYYAAQGPSAEERARRGDMQPKLSQATTTEEYYASQGISAEDKAKQEYAQQQAWKNATTDGYYASQTASAESMARRAALLEQAANSSLKTKEKGYDYDPDVDT